MKSRITLTLEPDIIRKIDTSVDGIKVKNRSHAIELMLLKALGKNKPKAAFILAGGKGTRLKPLTDHTPKPMIKVQGKTLLEHVFELLKKYGIRDVFISIGYKGDMIKAFYGDGRNFGLNISYIEEKEPLGTAGPLNLAKPFLTETFIMCNADELKDVNLIDMFLYHRERKGIATIALTTVVDPSAYGVARLKGDQIIEFVEKPKREDAPSNLINSGLYIIEPEIFNYLPKGPSMIEKDVFPKIAKEGRLFGYSFSGQWFDTGTHERLSKAEKEWKGL